MASFIIIEESDNDINDLTSDDEMIDFASQIEMMVQDVDLDLLDPSITSFLDQHVIELSDELIDADPTTSTNDVELEGNEGIEAATGTGTTSPEEEQTDDIDDNANGSILDPLLEGGDENEDMPEADDRFARLSEREIDSLLDNKDSKNTKKNTKWGVDLFKRWLSDRGMDPNFEALEDEQLDDCLRRFYAEARTNKGDSYSKSAFVGIRSSINRHLQNPPYERKINISQDITFRRANNMFISIIRKLKRDGQDQSKHYPRIAENDLILLFSESAIMRNGVFDLKNPRGLFNKVWFDVALNFARRGRENMRMLMKDSFQLKTDGSGREYYELTFNEFTKNHPGTSSRENSTPKPRMYASDNERCPVKSFKLYLSKLHPEVQCLFQKPKASVSMDSDVWFEKKAVGVNTISEIMPRISKEANLSTRYTNHSVRATAKTLLSHAGVETREIMKVSGHRNEASIKSYNNDSSDVQKQHYSRVLQRIDGNIQNEHIVPIVATDVPRINQMQHVSSQIVTSSTGSSQIVPVRRSNIHINNTACATSSRTITVESTPSTKQAGQFSFNNCEVAIYNYYGHQDNEY